ncbi:hypothetical protein [uncultured Eubacterium sp.]|uniref:hypothetical protein n=1 Tax=uncultured Eubacterium sp. TaxID=165185 RepID=UPI0015BA012C|nr:hypothetical protein [uncultured Eubacterium sp.]
MAKTKKGFRAGLYGVVSGILVAAILVGMTVFAFTTRYNAFSPEKVAQSYADTIVQTGDGYNALKISLVSKNQKFGNFVINAYMAPYVNDNSGKKKDEPKVEQNKAIGTGSKEETELLDQIYNTMYVYYEELMATVGLENYDEFYSRYFDMLKQVRVAVLGDDYMDTDFMFSVFESNVQTYANKLTGTKKKLAADKKTVLQKETTGIYQEMYGKEYKLTTTVTDTKELSADEVKAYADGYKDRIVPLAQKNASVADSLDEGKSAAMKEAFDNLNVADSIEAVDECTVEVANQKGDVVATVQVYVVRIGNSWYVDNSNTNTAELYIAQA